MSLPELERGLPPHGNRDHFQPGLHFKSDNKSGVRFVVFGSKLTRKLVDDVSTVNSSCQHMFAKHCRLFVAKAAGQNAQNRAAGMKSWWACFSSLGRQINKLTKTNTSFRNLLHIETRFEHLKRSSRES